MRPAKGERNRPAASCFGDVLIGRISIALHDASIMIEQLQSMHGAATRSVAVGNGGRIAPAPRAIVAGDGPEVSLLGAATAGIEHRHHRLVDCDLGGGEDELAQAKVKRHELGGRIAHPERPNSPPSAFKCRLRKSEMVRKSGASSPTMLMKSTRSRHALAIRREE